MEYGGRERWQEHVRTRHAHRQAPHRPHVQCRAHRELGGVVEGEHEVLGVLPQRGKYRLRVARQP